MPNDAADQMPQMYIDTSALPGVLIEWERNATSGVGSYNILRSQFFDGDYELLANVPWPFDFYKDTTGHPAFFYKIVELADDNLTELSTSQPRVGEELLLKESLAYELQDFLRHPIYDEEGQFNIDRTYCHFAYGKWNTGPHPPEIRISSAASSGDKGAMQLLSQNDPITTTLNDSDSYPSGLKYKLDWSGRVYFLNAADEPQPIRESDFVVASYYTKMIGGTEMNNALKMALNTINSQPGINRAETIAAAPYYWDPAIVYGAAYFLLRNMYTRLNHRETRLLMMDDNMNPDGIKSAAEMYKEQFNELLKALPKARYPHTYALVVPEFYLPGGRSRFFRYIWKGGAG